MKGFYEEEINQQAEERAAAPVTDAQRWLLAGTLLLGGIFTWIWHDSGDMPGFPIAYGLFWLVYLVLYRSFCPAQWRKRPACLALAGAAMLLCVCNLLQTWYGSGAGLFGMPLLNTLAVPCLLMLHAQCVAWPIEQEREARGYGLLVLYGFFVQPFRSIPACLRAVGSLFGSKREGKSGVWLGIAIALPIAGVVLALLLGADAVMNAAVLRWTQALQVSGVVSRGIVALVCALLFYSFLYRMAWGERPAFLAAQPLTRPSLAPLSYCIVAGTLLCIYAVFTYVQFVYLFGGAGLPEGLTYAEYAREGFSQLIWVAAINFSVFAFGVCRVRETPALRMLLAGLLVATGVILGSAFLRIFLYIGAYSLTLRRVMVVWFLLYLTAVLLLAALRLVRKGVPVLRLSTFGFVLWYLVLNAVDLMGLYVS